MHACMAIIGLRLRLHMDLYAARTHAGVGITNPILTRLIMGVVFPFGLLITLVCGAEL